MPASHPSDTYRGMPSSTLRHRPINPTTEEVEYVTPRASRPQYRPQRQTTDASTLVRSSRRTTDDTTQTRSKRRTTGTATLVTPERRTTGTATFVKINQQPIRTSAQPVRVRPRQKQQQSMHWSLALGLSMLAMVILLWLGQTLWTWGTVTYDDLKYGRPRTMQTDAFVGHETGTTPSHFIALNEQGRIEIIELPGGDAAHARIFIGPQIVGAGADLAPVTLTFIPSAPHSKLLDMQVSFQGTHVLFRNSKGTFVLVTS